MLNTVKRFRPNLVLVDKRPFGVAGEMRASLDAAKRMGASIVFGMRDILDDKNAVLKEWTHNRTQERISEYFDLMLVYGSPLIFDPLKEYRFPLGMRTRTEYCGYVVNQNCFERNSNPLLKKLGKECALYPNVLATTGGGEDGYGILNTFIQAAENASWRGTAVVGPLLCAQGNEALHKLAINNGVTIQRFIPDLSMWFSKVNALVCMGGYNTLGEALSQGIPIVCIPRIAPRKEQLLRATAFEKLGLLRVIRPEDLNVTNLLNALNQVLHLPHEALLKRVNSILCFDGATRAAGYLIALGNRNGTGVSVGTI